MILRSVEKQMAEQCEEGKAYCWMNCLDGHRQHCPHHLKMITYHNFSALLSFPWSSFVVPSPSQCLILIFQFPKNRVPTLQPSAKTRCLSHHDTWLDLHTITTLTFTSFLLILYSFSRLNCVSVQYDKPFNWIKFQFLNHVCVCAVWQALLHQRRDWGLWKHGPVLCVGTNMQVKRHRHQQPKQKYKNILNTPVHTPSTFWASRQLEPFSSRKMGPLPFCRDGSGTDMYMQGFTVKKRQKNHSCDHCDHHCRRVESRRMPVLSCSSTPGFSTAGKGKKDWRSFVSLWHLMLIS